MGSFSWAGAFLLSLEYSDLMLHSRIKDEIKTALRAREALRLSVLRSMLAAFVNELVATKRTPQGELTDEEALAVIARLARQRKDSIEQFRAGGREDLVTIEEAELRVLETYLPQQMPREEIERITREKMAGLNIATKENAGTLMKALMAELKGRADGAVVKGVVDALLA
ncbi:MAG: GatB/YqeY domain-containing protein [bacterium]|nr:GatB/YqeY domain-containing protein [bacterium]